jgi:hypothetical protein
VARSQAKPRCLGKRCRAVLPLTHTGHLKQGQAYALPMVFQNGRWVPARRLSIPYHHSYRLELSNWRSFPKLRQGARRTTGNAGGSTNSNAGGGTNSNAGGGTNSDAGGSTNSNAGGGTNSDAGGSTNSNAGGSTNSNAGGSTNSNAGGSTNNNAGGSTNSNAKGKRLVILEITKVKIQKVPRQRRWWAIYRARVLRVR